ncbi:MAG: HD domain-containing protein [Lachnospiraceae bacterium]|nr:HD domain-containing protein [Lachnospiraceae bacterium]
MSDSKNRSHKGLSIKLVAALNSVIAIFVLTIIVVIIGYHLFEKNVTENYEKYVTTVLEFAYSVATDHSFGEMIARREMPDEYEEMREALNKIKKSSDIDYLYAVYFDDINDINSLTYAINTKTKAEMENGGVYTYLGTPCEPGSFEEETVQILWEAVKSGRRQSAVLDGHSDEYGHMLNGYKVLFDNMGKPAGLLCVEIDINDISKELNQYVRAILLFVTIFTIIITIIYILSIEYHLIFPITSVTKSARDFIKNIGDQNAMEESVAKLKQLNIRSKNEVGELYETVTQMETDIAKQLNDIRQYAEHTLKMQNGLMVLMADMVEVRDSDTGAHIQKTAAYVKIILEGLQKKGYYKELLTPQYMEDVLKSAPLHDVGKIHIPDAVLNKTSSLTAEEYEIMKTHTTFGRAIIDRAITEVEGESYLREARNMAAYHHERWDGKGYPEGLKGEEIPLSARIMAVADVFDALTSPRIYKPAFPLSQAVKMIEDGKELQYDPKCVEVLIDSLPEVKEVLKKLNPGSDLE